MTSIVLSSPPERAPSRISTRQSGLLAPTIQLAGHASEVLSTAFSPDGRSLASAGIDREVFIWDVYNCGGEDAGKCISQKLSGHSAAVTQVQWVTSGKLLSCSGDSTVALWDVVTGKREKGFKAHSAVVNTCSAASLSPLAATGSDDSWLRLWDLRLSVKTANVSAFEHDYQILSVSMDAPGERVYAGTLDNRILEFDTRRMDSPQILGELGDGVTGIDISSDGNRLLSTSMDGAVCMWDIRAFCASGARLLHKFEDAVQNQDKMLQRIRWGMADAVFACGSSDGVLNIWNSRNLNLHCRLPGHSSSVNDVAFSPVERAVACSASSDRTLILGDYPIVCS